jgi:hypothetical protein
VKYRKNKSLKQPISWILDFEIFFIQSRIKPQNQLQNYWVSLSIKDTIIKAITIDKNKDIAI